MLRSTFIVVSLFALSTASVFSLAPRKNLIKKAFESIKDKDFRTNNHGYLCEQLAIDSFKKKYPDPKYQIWNSIVYFNGGGIIGELDLVVYNSKSKKAEVVGEVKCKSRPYSALKKAHDQLDRFLSNKSGKSVRFVDACTKKVVNKKIFSGKSISDVTVSYNGTVKKGFTYELELTFPEIKILHKKVKCYKEPKRYPDCS